ncbi:MAG: hypothetical protein U9Q89_02455 [Thermodesulfobacteriota bacterium]|nr:hypothetical protein [Thermodesulfobacteriota bacterium]
MNDYGKREGICGNYMRRTNRLKWRNNTKDINEISALRADFSDRINRINRIS